MTSDSNKPRAAKPADEIAQAHGPLRALSLVHRRPLLCATVVVVFLLSLAIVVFRPRYDTNDDTTMSFIVSGRVISQTPDEHMVFTHFLVGLVLKRLYLWAPAIPWYAVYLFSVHAAAHIALLYLLLKERVGLRWLAMYLVYAAVVGLMLLTSLQFTTTAFLAAQSGLFMGMFAFAKAADGDARLARRAAIAGALFLIASALIRWHVFMLFFSLALPAACVLAWTHRNQRQLILTAAALSGLLLAGLVGLARVNEAYYARDPRWRDFYSYNELRARINDLGWVYYSPETAHVFPQVGWSVNDYAMIQAWFYDDPAVYNATKLQELLDAFPWQETMPRQNRVADLLTSLSGDSQIILLLALLPLAVLILGRNRSAQTTLVLTCAWVCGIVLLATVLRKPPPARIYLPILSFPIALGLFLGTLPRPSGQIRALGDSAWPSRRRKSPTAALIAAQWACVVLAGLGVIHSLSSRYNRGRAFGERSKAFYRELESIAHDPEKLVIAWGASLPFELLRPTDSLNWLSNLRLLHLGWPQQCPFHDDMKLLFRLDDLPRELADRPDILLICDQACLRLMVNYIREHYGRDASFEQVAPFASVAMFRASTERQVANSGLPPPRN